MPYSNTKEKYLNGLKHGITRSRNNVAVGLAPDRGRTGFAKKNFQPGDFVCEYVGTIRQLDSRKGDWGDLCNQQLNTGCYCLDVTFNGIRYVIDATDEPNHPGRYINHARQNPNLVMLQPVTLAGELHCGLVAKRLIKAGQELFFDYGIPASDDHPWLNSDAKKIGITIDKGTEIMFVYHSFCCLQPN